MMDTLEHLERQVADSISLGEHLTAAEYITLLVKHCIADERAKVEAAGPPAAQTICGYAVIADEAAKAAAKQPEPDGDVPEWCKKAVDEWYDRENGFIFEYPRLVRLQQCVARHAKYELTRRGVEATADKDAEIAKLKSSIVAMSDSARQIADKDRRIAELEAIVADRSDMVKCVSDANSGLARHRDALTQQLATATAEVERLNVLIQATAEAWLSLEPGVAWEGAIDAAMKAGVGEIQKLRQQLADATRPVEDVSWDKLGVELQRHIEQVIRTTATLWLIENVKPLFQRERVARVAAESERDEWINACKELFDAPHEEHFCVRMNYEETQAMNKIRDLLAAYRAEKGKVTK